ncbi:MAG TPA: hypothetical protein VGO59_17320 [Verrucomicrobiae bacterium]
MTNLQDLTTNQLKRIIAIKEQIETLQNELASVTGNGGHATGKRRLSAAGRAAIIAGAKARWSRARGGKAAAPKAAKKGDRRSSPAVRAKLAAAAKARWARAKASGQNKL